MSAESQQKHRLQQYVVSAGLSRSYSLSSLQWLIDLHARGWDTTKQASLRTFLSTLSAGCQYKGKPTCPCTVKVLCCLYDRCDERSNVRVILAQYKKTHVYGGGIFIK